MTNFRDRRSTNGKAPHPTNVDRNAAERDREAKRAAPNRRLAPGARSASDWEAKRDKPLTRGDYVDIRASEEFSRREQSWIRRAWRWFTNRPPVKDMNGILAFAHARSLDDIEQRMVAQQRAEQDAATKAHPSAAKAAAKPEAPDVA